MHIPIVIQSAMLGRVRRALRALNAGRIDGDTYDRIMDHIDTRLDELSKH